MVREAGLEPARPQWTLEPESSESANSTTRAYEAFGEVHFRSCLPTASVYYHTVWPLSTLIFKMFDFFRGLPDHFFSQVLGRNKNSTGNSSSRPSSMSRISTILEA